MLYPINDSENELTPYHGSQEAVSASPSFPEIEKEVLSFWQEDDTFAASLAQREDDPSWVFYDGPPFANGLPHFGHLLTGYVKDLFPRYQTMRGRHVPRVFGWDTHGLPAELEAMKQLGITEKAQIEQMGVAEFNAAARDSVLTYTREWEAYVTRQARWVDFEGGYKTLDLTYMESVLWAFKSLYEKDLAYEGYRVLPYCWRDQTPLSNHELRMDDEVYKRRQDHSLTVTFPLTGSAAQAMKLEGVCLLAWTTTPWTLPTNLALAVGPEIEYAVLADQAGRRVMLAAAAVAEYAKDLGYDSAEAAQAAVQLTLPGKELAGLRYEPLFSYYLKADGVENAWQVLADDYVSTGEGTGIVHSAPAYGEDDKRICDAAGIPTLVSVDDGGCFLPEIAEYAGTQVFEANPTICRDLKQAERVIRHASYEHSYPHCWRCRNPLIYKAVTSWFVKVTALVDRMLELNQQINWIPENVKNGQFAKWLAGARDWSISRNRYWGTPIPVWKSDNPAYPRVDVYGSIAELERDFGVPVNDLHRPDIDELTRPNPDDPTGQSTMRRIPDVLDVWFDSASMPFAQVHYPFENQDWYEANNCADFIVEYVGQVRGWFYMMHVMSTALFDRPAFKNAICHGIILGDDGQKASKSLRNYPDVFLVFDSEGADAARWYLVSSQILRGGNLAVTHRGIREAVRQFILPLWNSWYFFSLYANAAGPDGYRAKRSMDSSDILDRYILTKTGELVREVTVCLDALDASGAAAKLRDFLEILTNWYIRRSRDRFWEGSSPEPFDTLYTVLDTLCRLGAPFAPMITEHVYKCLTGGRSVHLADWPQAEDFPQDAALAADMDSVREVCSAGLSLRKQLGIRARQPLASAAVMVSNPQGLQAYRGIIAGELNVKTVTIEPLTEAAASQTLKILPRVAGPRLGKQVQQVIAAAREGNWQQQGDEVIAAGIALQPGEYELELAGGGAENSQAIAGGGVITLDTVITPDLAAEGIARDAIRVIQDSRREAGLEVSDRIILTLRTPDQAALAALEQYCALVCEETLALRCQMELNESAAGLEVSVEKAA